MSYRDPELNGHANLTPLEHLEPSPGDTERLIWPVVTSNARRRGVQTAFNSKTVGP